MNHLFFVYSNFHALICYSIIKQKGIPLDNIRFLTFRKTNIINTFKKNCIKWDSNRSYHYNKLKSILLNDKQLEFLNGEVTAYIPFKWSKHTYFFKDIVYYEEGIDVIQTNKIIYPLKEKLRNRFYFILFFFISFTLLLFKKRNHRVFFIGELPLYLNDIPKFNSQVQYFGVIDNPNLNQAKNIIFNKLNFNDLISVKKKEQFINNIVIPDPILSLLDFSSFILFIEKVIEIIPSKSFSIQFHPTDLMNEKLINKAVNYMNLKPINYEIINLNLDFLSISQPGLNFYGITSSLLFYSKMFGENNSTSLYKYLHNSSEEYKNYLKFRGPYNEFISNLEKFKIQLV